MEVSAIQNTPIPKQNQVKRNTVLTSALGGAGIGAVINGFQSFSQQKQLLKNGDVVIKNMAEEIGKIAEPEMKKQAQSVLDATQKFIAEGKISPKAIGINALKGAVMFGAVFAAVEVISKAIKSARAKKAGQPPQQV